MTTKETAMATTLAVRDVDGAQFPTAGTWEADAVHSSVEFVVRHLMVAKVKGRFERFSATLEVGDDPMQSKATASIEAASISTREEPRDNHLKSADFLEVDKFATVDFKSTGFSHVSGPQWSLKGDLTIHGVTREVTLDTEFVGVIADLWGGQRVGFSATTEIDRETFGLTWNQALEAGGLLVGQQVKIEIEIEAVRKEPAVA
jgi:polyisoprenoid-binding protein YceI